MSHLVDAEFLADAYIQEGVCPAPGIIIVACTLGEGRDAPANRIGVRRNGHWLDFGLSKEAILSVDADASGAAYVLGENGSVVSFDWRTPATQAELKASRQVWRNPAVEDLGPLRRIRLLGQDVVCAGSAGQAYRLSGGEFEHLPPLMKGNEALTIEDLAGHGVSDFIAVTADGCAAHFDGVRWQMIDLPTTASLSSLCNIDSSYAIAGKNGTLLLGSHAQKPWTLVRPLDPQRSYWGVAAHEGSVYAAHLGGVDRVEQGALVQLSIHEAQDLQFAVLRNATDGVWSFAGKTIGKIAGDRWQTVLHGSPVDRENTA